MSLQTIITIVQLIVAILLMVSILLQQRGSGLSGVLGGDDSVYRTKRGAEKTLFYATIVLSILFLGISGATLFT
jgi:preprotein translocase subunit SecG